VADSDGLSIVATRIAATERRLWTLGLARAFWPLFVLTFLFLAMALAGLPGRLGGAVAALLTLAFLGGAGVLFLRGYRQLIRPVRADAETALDRGSDLRPIAALTDRPADAGAAGQALWSRHRERALRELQRLRPPGFAAEWRALDPYRLRYVLPAAVAALAVLAGATVPERLGRAFSPDLGALVGADKMIVEAWVTPPEHTGRAPIFLKPGLAGVTVPTGSEITLRTKAPSAPKLVLKAKKTRTQKFVATPDGAFEAKALITADTRVVVRWWGERAAWRLKVSPDTPPTVKFVSMPFMGKRDATEFTWSAADDYGVAKLELAISLQTPDPAAPEAEDRVALSLPAEAPQEASDTATIDLTRHRWAGLPVNLRLIATDGAGQEGASASAKLSLPEKFFLDPLARVAQEVRVTVLREPRDYKPVKIANLAALLQGRVNTEASNRLDLAPPGVQRAHLMLDSITLNGERYFENLATFLAFRTAHGVLESAGSKPEADAVDPLLWALALKIEYGSAADALTRLQAAKAALEQALRTGASEEEIKRRVEAFREAATQYLAAKMAEAVANGMDAPPDNADQEMASNSDNVGGNDIDDMLNALADLSETGASDQARKLLSDITNMLENLEFQKGNGQGQAMPGMPGQQANEPSEDQPPEEQELNETMQRLSEILREQRQLNDDTLAEQRGEAPGQGQEPSPGAGQQQPGQDQGGGQQAGQGAGEGEEQSGAGGGAKGEGRPSGKGQGKGQRLTEGTLAERQAQLGELVEKLAREKGLGKTGQGGNALEGKVDPKALGDIREAQKRAEELLGMGNGERAARNQERASGLLSELTGDLARQLDDMRQAREGGGGDASRDPFGRMTGGGGNDSEGVEIPAEAERQRAKDILDELRKRYNEAETEEERDYLRRLLDRF
jgi:Domain of unknown function (DUF4175)